MDLLPAESDDNEIQKRRRTQGQMAAAKDKIRVNAGGAKAVKEAKKWHLEYAPPDGLVIHG